MSKGKVAAYGSWRSPISAAEVATSGSRRLGTLVVDGDDVYWVESRPAEEGRTAIVRRDREGRLADVTRDGYNARTRVHEYGGGAFCVHGAVVFFSNFRDQRLYRRERESEPSPITPEPASPATWRYADGCVTPDGRLLVCVRERHEEGEVTNELVATLTDGSAEPWIVASGRDFYSCPRISPDGRHLAWTTWDHPNMPWDGTELWTADLSAEGRVSSERRVAGGPSESVTGPVWDPGGVLHFVSDRTGWWNLYREREGEMEALSTMEAEFAGPQWVFGVSSYGFLPDGRIACGYEQRGEFHLALLDPASSRPQDLGLPHTAHAIATTASSRIVFIGGTPTAADALWSFDPESGDLEVLRRSSEVTVDPAYVSVARAIEFPTGGDLTAHAFFHEPTNPDFDAPSGERPPLIVMSHGGPTSAVSDTLDLEIQFFTSRGFAVVDVNYGGSTGYGREYRERLRGKWGVVDLEDCANAAHYLVEQGEVDGARLLIRGGSAGGYTTLCALTFTNDFAAGASYYGVADLEALARDTHKFESRYLDGLVAPYPDGADVYRERSPIHFTDRLSCPVILFQGLEDAVVPPAQAEMMIKALDAKGLSYAYLAFEGEQHGFRKAETNRRCLEAELFFYASVLGIDLADPVEPVEIAHL